MTEGPRIRFTLRTTIRGVGTHVMIVVVTTLEAQQAEESE